MPDNWGFVIAAYALALVVFSGYWRRLARREREVAALGSAARNNGAGRSRQPSETAHPRLDPGKGPSLQ
jgi:hypothetical protein